jgi:CheY-like chemotaxis protein
MSDPKSDEFGLGGASADFVASLGRKVTDARVLLARLEADPTAADLRGDLGRRLQAMGTTARMLKFQDVADALAEAQAILERASESGGASVKALGQVGRILDDLPALAWKKHPAKETPPPSVAAPVPIGDPKKPVSPTSSAPPPSTRAPEPRVARAPADVFAAPTMKPPSSHAPAEPLRVDSPRVPKVEPARVQPATAAAAREPARPVPPPEASTADVGLAPGPGPLTVLVVGPESVAESLVEDAESRSSRPLEVERTDDVQAAVDLARAFAPDVIVLDASAKWGDELVEALSEDPLTEAVPVVAVGELTRDRTARLVALGVAKTIAQPYTSEVLLRALEEVVDAREGRTMRIALGEPTVEQLAQRLADEVYRGIAGAASPQGREQRVYLGEGTEILGAVWGAIARVREVLTVRTGGAVRFGGPGPEGAIAMAPWLDPEVAGADRAKNRGRGAGADVRLEGRRVVVADDDPGVTWYIADLLRTTGCIVHEALDGKTALEVAQRTSPDLVISDILMPELDGFALSRAMKRDVVLRDVPVILLSWKEDLLQRVRELGASAAAYLRKESDARAILARVREVLWPRARLEARLKGTGEVRGRLDGLTVRTLLETVALVRPVARVSVRDATCLYEVQLEGGAPRRATRTSPDGSFARGERVLAQMLGASAGRFAVGPSAGVTQGELSGTLDELLARPIAAARGALATTTGAAALHVRRVRLDEEVLDVYLGATPEPARGLVRTLAAGASPKDLIVSGTVVPSLLEDVLADLAAHGAVVGVEGESGEDLLAPAVSRALSTLQGAPPRQTVPFSALRMSRPPPPKVRPWDHVQDAPASAPRPAPPAPVVPPSSLADAVMRELSERSPAPAPGAPKEAAPLVDTAELRPRTSSRPPEDSEPGESEPFELVSRRDLDEIAERREEELSPEAPVAAPRTKSVPPPLPPQAVAEPFALSPSAEAPAAEPATDVRSAPVEPVITAPLVSSEPAAPTVDIGERTEVEAIVEAEVMTPSVPIAEASAPQRPAPARATPHDDEEEDEEEEDEEEEDEAAQPSIKPSAAPVSVRPKPQPQKGGAGFAFVALAGVAIIGAVAVKLAVEPSPAPGGDEPLPAGVVVTPGEGIVEVHAADGAAVLVDGVEHGKGPFLRITLPAGRHEVRTGAGVRVIDVRSARLTKVDLAPAP